MFLSRKKPTSPAKRWESTTTNRYFKRDRGKKILHYRQIRGFEVKKTKRKSLLSPTTKYYGLFNYFPFQCFRTRALSIHKITYANYLIANIKFGSGGSYYIKAPSGASITYMAARNRYAVTHKTYYKAGDRLPVYMIPTGGLCYSLRTHTSKRWSVAEAAGTFCKILWHSLEKMHTAMRLPSKKLVKLNLLSQCNAGRVSNSFLKYTKSGNAKAAILKKKKIISVRGVAMNPVDHPNGGRANTKQPLKNPWGRIAKKGK